MTSDPQKNAFDLDYSSRERQFPEGFKRKIVADLQEGMPQFDVLQYFGNQPDIFETYDHLVLATDPEGERIIGILGAKDFVRGATRFLYLWTAMVVDRYHRTSLFKRINQFFLRQVSERNGGLPPLIVAKTYNPVVYNMFRALSARIPGATLYPDLEAPRQSPDMVDLARDVVGTLSANLRLDAETGLIPGGQRSVAPDFFRAWRCPATPGPTTTSSPTSAAATRSSAWSASRPVPNPTCSRGSSGERTRAALRRPVAGGAAGRGALRRLGGLCQPGRRPGRDGRRRPAPGRRESPGDALRPVPVAMSRPPPRPCATPGAPAGGAPADHADGRAALALGHAASIGERAPSFVIGWLYFALWARRRPGRRQASGA